MRASFSIHRAGKSFDGTKGEHIADTRPWHKNSNRLLRSSLVAGTGKSVGHSRFRAGRMRCVLTAESSLRTFVLTLAAASRNGKRENPDLGRAVADEDYARSMHEGHC